MPRHAAHSRPLPYAQAGFTLIEMAIVLVIIGLLTAGILVGQTLVRQGQINSIMVDIQRYSSATKAFVDKYNALPGDMNNATVYWGAMSTCPPVQNSSPQGGTLTCNGDGNGQVYSIASGAPSGNTNLSETFLYWQHLQNAGMIQGVYTGIGGPLGSGAGSMVAGSNEPSGRLPGSLFSIQYEGTMNGDWETFDGIYNHVMRVGGYGTDGNNEAPLFTTAEAQSFDTKFDDGLPATGMVTTYKANYAIFTYTSPYCATTNVSSTALYNTTKSGLQCILFITTGF